MSPFWALPMDRDDKAPRPISRKLHSGFIDIGNLRVHHMYGGRGSPVVFVHGLGSSGYMEWRSNLDSVAVRHRVFAPDLPGFGRTDKPRVRYTVPYFARFVNTLGLGRPKVRSAQMAYGLVTVPRVGEAVMNFARDALTWAPATLVRRVAARYSGASVDLNRTMDDGYLNDLREMYAAAGFREAYLSTVRSLVNPRALFGGQHDVTRRLSELKIPVHLIWGADDPLFPLAHAERASSMMGRGSLAVIYGAGHTPQAERPEEFNRVLHEFLD